MDECTKNPILFALNLLQTALKETNTLIGIEINKKDHNKSKIAFINRNSYIIGDYSNGFTVSLDELNKAVINK